MYKLVCFLALISSLLVRTSSKVCGDTDVRVHMLNFVKFRDCEVIVGSMQIVLFDRRTEEDFKNVTFPKLREVTGYILFYQVSGLTTLGKLFPNLRVIRGMQLFHNYALILYNLHDLKEIGLTNLRYIARGSIRIDTCPHLCYFNTTDWSKIGPGQLEYYNMNPSQCKPCPDVCNGYCWNEHSCQLQTYTNCSDECLVCDSLNKCAVCKHHSDDGKCVSKCPEGKFSSRLVSQCLTEDECKALPNKTTNFIFHGECVQTCPLGYQLVPNKTDDCERCDGYCINKCNGTTVNSISSLQQIKGCTHVNGSLLITLEKDLKQIVGELEESLGEIREIRGQLKIQHTYHIKSLSFLKNLQRILGEGLAKNMPILTIVNNYDLHTLFDLNRTKLYIAPGKFSIHYNPQLCLSEIKALAINQLRMDSYNNEIDVSIYSNGDQAACNIVDLNITVTDENATSVSLTWKNFEKMDEKFTDKPEGKLIGYWIYYKKSNGFNITIYNSRDACDSEGWNTILVRNNSVTLTNLQPFTKYAFFIKTFTNDVEVRAETNIKYFRTLPNDPSPPLDFKIISNRSDGVLLTWKKPKSPNGELDKYILIGYVEEDNLLSLDNRNFCNKTVDTTPFDKELDIVTESPVRNSSCPCSTDVPTSIEPDVENVCYVSGSNEFISMDMSESCQRYKYSVIDTHLYSNVSNTTEVQQSWKREINASDTSLEILNLKHFTLYVVLLSACNRPDLRSGTLQCSMIMTENVRTLKKDDADDIPGGIKIETTSNNVVTVYWREPKDPNGAIVTYTIEIKRTDLTHAKADVKCITRREHELNQYLYRISLEPGSYSIRVQAVSMAGPGNFSAHHEFSIEMLGRISVTIIIVCSIIVIVSIGLIYYGYFWYRKQLSNNEMHLITSVNPDYMYVEDEWEMERSNIDILKVLGQGSFGLVYSGHIKSQNIPCAVKTVNENFNMFDKMEFLNEASVMKCFNDAHHVVRLLGVVSRGQPPLAIMELMARGDLKTYLRRSRESSHNITCAEMYRMSAEIADGMGYLAAKKYIHRDLAARNCMVSADYTVKIGDFGMARDIYETDYYRKETAGLLPVRWMSPESLADGVFTSDSDVWSYGVVLWEMVTLAEQPYQGLANEQVLQYVVGRGTLVRPVDCPDLLYEIMEACWKWKPNDRPLFTYIVEKLESHIGQDFRLVSFYHSREGEEYRMNTKERVYNAPALSVAAQSENCAHWNASDDEVSLYSGDASRPNKFLSFPHQRHSRSSPNYHLENSSPTNAYTSYSFTSM